MVKERKPWAKWLSGFLATAMVATLLPNVPANVLEAKAAVTPLDGKFYSFNFKDKAGTGTVASTCVKYDTDHFVVATSESVGTEAVTTIDAPSKATMTVANSEDFQGWSYDGTATTEEVNEDATTLTIADVFTEYTVSGSATGADYANAIPIDITPVYYDTYTLAWSTGTKAGAAATANGTVNADGATSFKYYGSASDATTTALQTWTSAPTGPAHYATWAGWTLDGTTVLSANPTLADLKAVASNKVVTVYSLYTEDTFALTFAADGNSNVGGITVNPVSVSYSDMVAGGYSVAGLNSKVTTTDGYKLAAWTYTKTNADSTTTSGVLVDTEGKIETYAATTVTAVTEGIDFALNYSVDTIEDASGEEIPSSARNTYKWTASASAPQSGLHYGDSTATLAVPTMTGYSAAWYAKDSSGVEFALGNKTVSEVAAAAWGSGKSAHDNGTINVYAKWSAGAPDVTAYTVEFYADKNCATKVSNSTALTGNDGTKIIKVKIPEVAEATTTLADATDAKIADIADKVGYHVTSWVTTEGTVVYPGGEYDLTSDKDASDKVKVYPQTWAPNKYTVKFAKGSGSGELMKDVEFTYDKGVAAPESTYKAPEGMEFKNWTYNKIIDNDANDTGATKPDDDNPYSAKVGDQMINLTVINGATVTVTPKFVSTTKYEYRYTGGEGGEGSYVQEVAIDDNATLTAAEAKKKGIKRTGYSISKWKTFERETPAEYAPGASIAKKSTEEYVALEPVWVPENFRIVIPNNTDGDPGEDYKGTSTGNVTAAITLNIKVGTGAASNETDLNYEGTLTNLNPVFTRANTVGQGGYTINALYLSNAKNGTSFAKDEAVDVATLAEYAQGENNTIVMYPEYIPNTYTVKFAAGTGADGEMDDIEVTYGAATALPTWKGSLTAPSASHTFKGWTLTIGDAAYKGAEFDSAAPIADKAQLGTPSSTNSAIGNLSKGVPSDATDADKAKATVTLTATWDAPVTAHFYQKEGDTAGDTVIVMTADGRVPAWKTVIPERAGFTFDGWKVEENLTKLDDNGILNGTTYATELANNDVSLYGTWVQTEEYRVEFWSATTASSTPVKNAAGDDLTITGLGPEDGIKFIANGETPKTGEKLIGDYWSTDVTADAPGTNKYQNRTLNLGYKFLGWARSATATTPDYEVTTTVENSIKKLVYPTIKVSDFEPTDWDPNAAHTVYTAKVYAVWAPEAVKVTYDVNQTNLTSVATNAGLIKGTETISASEMGDQVIDYSATATLDPFDMAASKAGLTLAYWTVGNDTTQYADKEKIATLIASEYGANKVTWTAKDGYVIPMKAHWKLATNTITYNTTQDHQYKATYTIDGTVTASAPITITKTAKAYTQKFTGAGDVPQYYTFEGWYTDAALTKPVSGEGFDGSLQEDVELFAKFASKEYTVEFMANGGSGTSVKQTFYATDKKALTKNSFTNNGKVFAGWSKTSGGAQAFVDKAVVTLNDLGASNTNTTVRLYAMWKAAGTEFTLTFDPKGGEYAAADMKGYTKVGNNYTIKYKNGEGYSAFPTPKKAGYTFAGYKINQSGEKITAVSKSMAGDLTVNAQWTPNKVTLKFDSNKATGESVSGKVGNVSGTSEDALKIPADTYSKKGYRFLGYSFYKDYTKVTAAPADDSHGYNANKLFAAGDYITIADATSGQTVTMYAQWAERSYRIDYDLGAWGSMNGVNNVSPVINGGVFDFYQEYKYDGKTAPQLAVPKTDANKGVTFVGWYKYDEFTDKYTLVKSLNSKTAEDMELYAAYKVEAIINYHATSAAAAKNQKLVISNTLLGNPKYVTLTKNGFKAPNKGDKFLGWAEAEGTNKVAYGDKEVLRAMQVYGMVGATTNEKDLYAVFGTSQTYTVTFEAQTDVRGTAFYPEVVTSGMQAQITYEFGTGIDKKAWKALPAPSRPGYKFDGWAEFNSGKKITAIGKSATGNLTVVPIWKGGTAYLVYDVQSTKPADSVVKTKNFSQKFTLGKTIYRKNTKVVASDKSAFVAGWYVADANGNYLNAAGGPLYAYYDAGQTQKLYNKYDTSGIDYNMFTVNAKGNLELTLVADWQERAMFYIYDIEDAYFDSSTAAVYGINEVNAIYSTEYFMAGSSTTPPTPSRDGYTFKGWKIVKSNGKLGGSHKKRSFSKIKWVTDKADKTVSVSNIVDAVEIRATWKADK